MPIAMQATMAAAINIGNLLAVARFGAGNDASATGTGASPSVESSVAAGDTGASGAAEISRISASASDTTSTLTGATHEKP